LTSDIHSESIVFYTEDRGITKERYAELLVDELLPGSLKMLARNRWITSTVPLKQFALLEVHSLFSRAAAAWCAASGTKSAAKSVPKAKSKAFKL
jgi:hypothetical protein